MTLAMPVVPFCLSARARRKTRALSRAVNADLVGWSYARHDSHRLRVPALFRDNLFLQNDWLFLTTGCDRDDVAHV